MYPVIDVFGIDISVYALAVVVGLFVCTFASYRLSRRYGYTLDDVLLLMLSIVAGIFIGGHLFYGLTNTASIIKLFKDIGSHSASDFIKYLLFFFGGQVFYGGLIGALVAIRLHTMRSRTLKHENALDVFAVAIPLFHAFGRVGCFMAGCCYGIESEWGIVFHNALTEAANGVSRLPVQLIEVALNLLIFAVLLKLFISRTASKRLIYIYLFIYPAIRFVLEFFRGDEIRGFLLGLSTSQWISIALIVYAAVALGRLQSRNRRISIIPD